MDNTTLDILYLVLSFVILWIGIGLGFVCFYAAKISREFYLTVHGIRDRVERLDRLFAMIKDKLESSSASLGLLVDGVMRGVGMFERFSKNRAEKKKEKQDKKENTKRKSKIAKDIEESANEE